MQRNHGVKKTLRQQWMDLAYSHPAWEESLRVFVIQYGEFQKQVIMVLKLPLANAH